VALGPIVAGFLFNNMLPMLFIGDALTSFIAVLLVWTNIKDGKHEKIESAVYSEEEKEEKGSILNALLKRPQILVFLIIYVVYSFSYTQHRFSLPLTVEAIFSNSGAEKFGFLMSINAFSVLLFTVGITSLTKGLKPLVNIIIAGVLYAVGFGMIGGINSFYLFVLSTILWTIGEILVVTNFGVYMANNSPSNFRARFSALGSLSWAIGGALGTSAGGKYIQVFGLSSIWSLTFVLSIIGAALMFLLLIYSNRKARS
jgi:predicted MFS family arabinose efflux permease